MIIAIVTFPTPAELPADPRALLEAAAPAYQEVPGLERKFFMGNARAAGGVYQWRDQDSAERFYDDDWRRTMQERYGAVPSVEFFAAPCLVDNVSGQILYDLEPIS